VVAEDITLTAQGPFSVMCSMTDDGGSVVVDERWETPFCSELRTTLALDRWIAAAK